MRIVADTNLVVSAFLWGGVPRQLLDAVREHGITLCTSPALIAELEDVLSRGKFAKRFALTGLTPALLLDRYRALATLVEPAALSAPVSRDADDDQVLACALAAQADFIASGDGDLLVLKSFQGMPIVTAAQALQRIAEATT